MISVKIIILVKINKKYINKKIIFIKEIQNNCIISLITTVKNFLRP
jgi:hypothetical protein